MTNESIEVLRLLVGAINETNLLFKGEPNGTGLQPIASCYMMKLADNLGSAIEAEERTNEFNRVNPNSEDD